MTSHPIRPSSGSGLRPIQGIDLREEWPGGSDEGADPDYYDDEPGRPDRFRRWLGRVLAGLTWLGLAAAVALGSAGVVAATQHSPAAGGRPELTWGADQSLKARLDASVRALVTLNDQVEHIGTLARSARSAVSQVSAADLGADVEGGNAAVLAIDAGAAKLNGGLGCQSWDAAREAELAKTYSSDMIDRYHQVCLAIASVAPIHDSWDGLVASGRVAMQVAADINDHDTVTQGALKSATAGRYSDAIAQLDAAAASITDATRIATLLAKVADVSTLQDWLTRTKNMDDALRLLWQTVRDSNGRVTSQVKAALKNVADVKALLPDGNAVLAVVMYELGVQMTADGISIEVARGQLSSALSDLVGGTVFGP